MLRNSWNKNIAVVGAKVSMVLAVVSLVIALAACGQGKDPADAGLNGGTNAPIGGDGAATRAPSGMQDPASAPPATGK
ncbi:MAG: hypothetical protein K0R75_3721 [Paenibacillaceae bacterium]|jgi:hypothetical protein|nr:hypothetical protein [Paenibacillaceae bacterium]